jgi:hypothetical protein
MSTNGKPKLDGCSVLEPMEPDAPTPTPRGEGASKRKQNNRKTANRFADLNNFIDCTMGSLTRNEMAVWFILYRDTRNGIAVTSQDDIARRAGTSDRTVRRIIKQLEGRKLLKTVYRGGLQRGSSKYRVFPLAEP